MEYTFKTSRENKTLKLPLSELLKSVPGIFGIRLEEEPAYDVVAKFGEVEIRRYVPMVLAQVEIEGSHDEALDRGFEVLASYIFGENAGKEHLAMTTPVIHENPAQTVVSHSSPVEVESGKWKISFVLPADLDLESAPTPLDSRVKLSKTKAKVMATVRYSGKNDDANRNAAAMKLNAWLEKSGVRAYPPLIWAQYDQPFSVPALRRNEVQIEIDTPSFS